MRIGKLIEKDGEKVGKPVAILARNYPTIEHFAISNAPVVYKGQNCVRNRDIQKFIELNPQLKSIASDNIESDGINFNQELSQFDFMLLLWTLISSETEKVLTLSGIRWDDDKVETVSEFLADMPQLTEIIFSYEHLTKRQIVRLLTSSKSLSKATFNYEGNTNASTELQSNKIDADIDVSGIGWAISSHNSSQIVLNRVSEM